MNMKLQCMRKNVFSEKEIQQTSCAVTCINHGEKPEVAVNVRNGDDEKELRQFFEDEIVENVINH